MRFVGGLLERHSPRIWGYLKYSYTEIAPIYSARYNLSTFHFSASHSAAVGILCMIIIWGYLASSGEFDENENLHRQVNEPTSLSAAAGARAHSRPRLWATVPVTRAPRGTTACQYSSTVIHRQLQQLTVVAGAEGTACTPSWLRPARSGPRPGPRGVVLQAGHGYGW